MNKGDKIIMLYDVNRIMTSLFNCSHLLYTVYSVVDHATYAYFTESLWLVGEAQVDGFFPSKIVVQIHSLCRIGAEGYFTRRQVASIDTQCTLGGAPTICMVP